jgi:hypothetical protein
VSAYNTLAMRYRVDHYISWAINRPGKIIKSCYWSQTLVQRYWYLMPLSVGDTSCGCSSQCYQSMAGRINCRPQQRSIACNRTLFVHRTSTMLARLCVYILWPPRRPQIIYTVSITLMMGYMPDSLEALSTHHILGRVIWNTGTPRMSSLKRSALSALKQHQHSFN